MANKFRYLAIVLAVILFGALPAKAQESTSLYVAGYGGVMLPELNELSLKSSYMYGLKVGFIPPRNLTPIGLELEAFVATPHMRQRSTSAGTVSGAHVRAYGVAGNFVLRPAKQGDFLQPYIGAGPAVVVLRTSDGDGDHAVALSALAGMRFVFTDSLSLFVEYKHIRTGSFDLTSIRGVSGPAVFHNFVGGLALNF